MIQAAFNGTTWIQGIEITTYLFEAFSAYFGSANMFRPYQVIEISFCLLYTSPSPRDLSTSRMPSSA